MYRYMEKIFNRFIEHDLYALSCQLAYSLVLSFFPFLIFLLTLVGYSSLKSTEVLIAFKSVLPGNVFQLLRHTVIEIVDGNRADLLSYSAIATIWVGSSGFRAVIRGLNKAYDQKEHRSYLKIILISILSMFVLALIILFAFSFVVLGEIMGNAIINFLGFSRSFKFNWDMIRFIISMVFMTLTFALLYRITPCITLKWREVIPGSIFSTIGWIISSQIFSFYVNNFNNYSRVYGSLGAVIAFMIWLFISSMVILLGGEINAMLFLNKENK